MATRFEITQQSLIKKYQNLNTYFKNWNVSEAYVKSHSTPQNLRINIVKASWGRYYGNDDNGSTLIDARIEELKQAKSMDDLQNFINEIGTGSAKSFLNYQTDMNKDAWTESVLEKFKAIYQGLNKGYGILAIGDLYIYIEELKMYVQDLDASKLTFEQINKIKDYMELFYEEMRNGDKIAAKENLLKMAKIVYNRQKYKRFETILDNYL